MAERQHVDVDMEVARSLYVLVRKFSPSPMAAIALLVTVMDLIRVVSDMSLDEHVESVEALMRAEQIQIDEAGNLVRQH